MKKTLKTFYRRRLPHVHPIGGTFFVTVCLKGSIPKKLLKKLQKIYEEEISEDVANKLTTYQMHLMRLYLSMSQEWSDEWHLAVPEVAEIVKEQLHRFDGELYDLIAYSIMSNHFHVIFDTSLQLKKMEEGFDADQYVQVYNIMRKIKGASARYANQLLGRTGPFWHGESWDRWIRDEEELERWIHYTLQNPVKAGMVDQWQDWQHNYLWSNS